MISNKMFTQANVLEKAMNASWLRNEVISNNIANIDTPGYKRKTVEFESLLANALGENKSLSTLNLSSIEPKVQVENQNLRTRLDENNVDVDTEMTEMAKNYLRYNTLQSMVSNNLKRINAVLNLK